MIKITDKEWEDFLDDIRDVWSREGGTGLQALNDCVEEEGNFDVDFRGGTYEGNICNFAYEGEGEWTITDGSGESPDVTIIYKKGTEVIEGLREADDLDEFYDIYQGFVDQGIVDIEPHVDVMTLSRKGYAEFGKKTGLV